MSSDSNLVFGFQLRAHRERRGITLATLAESMKVKQSLLNELERNDVSRWPPGIYGRALVREYAKLVGLPPDDMVQQFVQLSAPADAQGDTARSRRERADADAAELRLTFARLPGHHLKWFSVRVIAAAVELAFVVVTGCLVAAVIGSAFSTSTAVLALMFYPARAVFYGHDGLYRILRLHRLSTSSSWSQTAELSPAASVMSLATNLMEPGLASAEDSFMISADLDADRASAAVH